MTSESEGIGTHSPLLKVTSLKLELKIEFLVNSQWPIDPFSLVATFLILILVE